MASSYAPEVLKQGWLTKSKPNSKKVFGTRSVKSWFTLKVGTLPNQYFLEYFKDSSCRRSKGKIKLDECEQFKSDRQKFAISLITSSKVYVLSASSETELDEWVACLCHVCGLKLANEDKPKVSDVPAIVTPRPHRSGEALYENLEVPTSDESCPPSASATKTSCQHQYIHITECFSGKPVKFPDTPNQSPYCNTPTSFPFPPKVNWETHPRRKDSASSLGSPNDKKLVPPPRPPKKSPLTSLSLPPTITEGDGIGASNHIAINEEQSCEPEECPDSSSTSSSPPVSAGTMNSDTPEVGNNSKQLHSPSSSSTGTTVVAFPFPADGETPPKVDRTLKPNISPGVATTVDSAKNFRSPTYNSNSWTNRSMTLPVGGYSRSAEVVGPPVDRSRKPDADETIKLDPTPHQKKYGGSSQVHSMMNATSTLPSGSGRRSGPKLSPKEGLQYLNRDRTELQGTYLKLECSVDNGRSGSLKPSTRRVNGPQPGDVEYRMIDHEKTSALNKMIQYREKQLRTEQPLTLHY